MILCFTGTGNSLHIAHIIADILGDDIAMIPLGCPLPPPSHGRIIWIFPCHSWGVPPIVMQAIEQYSAADIEHYAVITCGDDIGHTHKMWRKLITKAGGTPCATYSVQMPNTYVCMKGFDVDPKHIAEAKLNAAIPRAKTIARHIAERVHCDDVVQGNFAWIKTAVIRPWFLKYAMKPHLFHADDSKCTKCKLCVRECPLGNISMPAELPQWSDNCALCLRCYHSCPRHAISYGHATEGKGQYINRYPAK